MERNLVLSLQLNRSQMAKNLKMRMLRNKHSTETFPHSPSRNVVGSLHVPESLH